MVGLAGIVARLTAPWIISTEALPRFANTCGVKREGEEPARYASVSSQLSLGGLFGRSTEPSPALPRAIFLGEQHHQPKVLAAQLQVIHQLFEASRGSKRRIHVVLEQWSLADQVYLNRLNREGSSACAPVAETTSEGFSESHYMPIVKLVLEMGGTVWAGFPPRSWAKLVSTADECAFEEVQQLDEARYREALEKQDKTEPTRTMADTTVPPLPASEYRHVEHVSWPHRAYLKSMFRPDERPMVGDDLVQAPPPAERKGFLAAQALKDTFLAHTMASILAWNEDNVVLAITGLGHCEWGFGAPERLKSMSGVEPFLIMTKPDDTGYWTSSPPAAELGPDWDAKQADAIIVYEWVD